MAGPTLSAAGLSIQDLATIRQELAADVRAKTGISTLLVDDDSSPLGQLLGVFAERESLIQELLADVYLSAYVVSATGAALDVAVAKAGIVRQAATYSYVDISISNPTPPATGAFTVPAGALIELDATGDRWGSVAGVTVADGATEVLRFISIASGPVAAPQWSNWSWITSFVGSSEMTLVNSAAAVVGAAVETDAALRLRYFQVLAQAGTGTVQAVRASVLALATVTQARVYENDSNVLGISSPESIPTLPAHSFLVVARGTYSNAEIAAAIFAAKPVGIEAFGTVSYTVTDDEGVPHVISWRPAAPLVCTLALVITGSSSGYHDAVKAAVIAYVDSLGMGEDVLHVRIVAAVLGAAVGATAVSGTLNGTALSLSGALAVDYYQYPSLLAAAIAIT